MPPPCQVKLAVNSMMIAAKVQEVEPPLYEEMVDFLKEKVSVSLTRDELIGFESTILRTLNFDVGPETNETGDMGMRNDAAARRPQSAGVKRL